MRYKPSELVQLGVQRTDGAERECTGRKCVEKTIAPVNADRKEEWKGEVVAPDDGSVGMSVFQKSVANVPDVSNEVVSMSSYSDIEEVNGRETYGDKERDNGKILQGAGISKEVSGWGEGKRRAASERNVKNESSIHVVTRNTVGRGHELEEMVQSVGDSGKGSSAKSRGKKWSGSRSEYVGDFLEDLSKAVTSQERTDAILMQILTDFVKAREAQNKAQEEELRIRREEATIKRKDAEKKSLPEELKLYRELGLDDDVKDVLQKIRNLRE